jgi:hypothetical protein
MNDICEECGAIATRTVRGIMLCDDCEHGGDDANEPPHWAHEIPSGLLDGDDYADA